jgi:A/G-specific adenine glycosylase
VDRTEPRSRALHDWYLTSARDLPWRRGQEPWSILVAEVMSQQTQIERVVTAHLRFLDRFPTPSSLAAAGLAEVIETWGNLGYQRRAVNLWRAAALIEAHGWPTTVDGLRRLPGVGAYTAAAVGCFAFDQEVPAVDTNLRRVAGRWLGRTAGPDDYRLLMNGIPARDWNQAVMDLAADICTPDPDCPRCPVTDWCRDPGFYQPPARQSTYRGSVRQARAMILKALATGGGVESVRHEQSQAALTALVAEGLVVAEAEGFRLTRV